MPLFFLNPPFFSHYKNKGYTQVIKEICFRAFYLFLCFILSCCSIWTYSQEVLYLYLSPLYNLSQNIIFTSISEAFYTTVYLCVLLGIASTVPFCIYLFLCFVLPSLFPKEKREIYILCFCTAVFYLISLWLCSIYILPELLCWFLKYGDSDHAGSTNFLYLSLQAKLSSYVSWSIKIYLFCILVLQVPLFLTVLFFKYQNVFYGSLKNRKYMGCSILLFCALVSPPDFYSQGFLFCFFMVLFEFVLWFTLYQNVLKQKKLLKKKKTI